MKNKYILFLLEAIFLLSGCCETITPEETPSLPSVALVQFESWESVTKTSFGEKEAGNYPILWANTDQVGVTVNAANAYKSATVTPSADAHRATFSATLDLPELPYKLQAVSPASAIVAFDGTTSVTLNIPASQNPETNGPDPKAQFLVAETTLDETPSGTVPMHFHHATAYGCLSLTNLPTVAQVLSIDLVFDVPVSGKWDCALSDQIMTPNVPANIITLHTDKATNVFFACAPADLQGTTMKVRLNTEDGIYERTVSISADRSFKQGVVSKFEVDMSTSSKKTSISILAIGHSYAVNATVYLYPLLKEIGFTDIVLGVEFKGNCSLSEHVKFYNEGTKYVTSYRNSNDVWIKYNNTLTLDQALNEREWDYITMQQEITGQGKPYSYQPYLNQLIDIVREYRPESKLIWHRLWAFATFYGGLSSYGNNQLYMYECISNATQSTVLPTGAFGDVIPAGTAIQNLLTSYIEEEDILTDGYHSGDPFGRYAVALMWTRQFSGQTIQNLTWTPKYPFAFPWEALPEYLYTEQDILAVKEAVESAYVKPYEVTISSFSPNPPVPPEPDPGSEPDPGDGNTSGENFTIIIE